MKGFTMPLDKQEKRAILETANYWDNSIWWGKVGQGL
jgi:hypothetical protein